MDVAGSLGVSDVQVRTSSRPTRAEPWALPFQGGGECSAAMLTPARSRRNDREVGDAPAGKAVVAATRSPRGRYRVTRQETTVGQYAQHVASYAAPYAGTRAGTAEPVCLAVAA
jgi:hypothetical protein